MPAMKRKELFRPGSAWKHRDRWPKEHGTDRVKVFLLVGQFEHGKMVDHVVEGWGRKCTRRPRFTDEFGDCTTAVRAWRHFEEEDALVLEVAE